LHTPGDVPEHVDVELRALSLFIQREKLLHELHISGGGGGDADRAAAAAEETSFLFNKDICKYRSFAPELLLELLSQDEGDARQSASNHLSALPAGPEPGSKASGSAAGGTGSGIAATVNRIIFVEAGSASNKDKPSKNRRKEDAQKERIIRFLQDSVGIAMLSANADHMPVLVSDLSYVDLRGLGTALSMGAPPELASFFASKPAIRRALKLIVAELRYRASIVLEGGSALASPIASSSQTGGSGGGAASDSTLFYAMLYSTKDDRFDMVSYTYSVVSATAL
jgi:hypothetical protein